MDTLLKSFIDWSHRNNVFINDKIDFRADERKGMFAVVKERMLENENLIKLPKELAIGPDMIKSLFPDVKLTTESNSNNEMMVLLISKLKFDTTRIGQFFKPYLDILPKAPSLPLFWEPTIRNQLKSTDAELKLEAILSKLLSEWYNLMTFLLKAYPHLVSKMTLSSELKYYEHLLEDTYQSSELYEHFIQEGSSWTSFRSYVWSYSILTSRGFPYFLVTSSMSEKDLKTPVLLPVIDLLNHRNNFKIKYLSVNETREENVIFKLDENVAENQELFNNYGDKPNVDLLLNYGFAVEGNEYDETTITFKIDEGKILEAIDFGIEFYERKQKIDDPKLLKNGINFYLDWNTPFPLKLVDFFAFLVQMKFEKETGMTLRMKLEGLTEIRKILVMKVETFKENELDVPNEVDEVFKYIKIYKKGQRLIFQKSLDSLQSYEKKLLKQQKAKMISFKTILKNDEIFMKYLSTSLNVYSYEDILGKKILDVVILLWILRLYNLKEYPKDKFLNDKAFKSQIDVVISQFQNVKRTIDITQEDLLEQESFLSLYFSLLPNKFSDIYGRGDWKIEDFVVASTVADRIIYLRPINQEAFIVPTIKLS
ncbi:uncharacterized protein PRCAT00001403001 [Priceomyces carsonii]|uniref:uncharacterized protein n=1 Tax=Priceomyces carsonii TaxID=28549 RepID=UPI002ED882B0|nr:unnamed protein product [Priceomyces carsonii]